VAIAYTAPAQSRVVETAGALQTDLDVSVKAGGDGLVRVYAGLDVCVNHTLSHLLHEHLPFTADGRDLLRLGR